MSRGGPRPNSGGRRPGAGRPKAATTRKTRRLADQYASDGGVMPLEVMLTTMRALWDRTRQDGSPDWEARKEAVVIAREAAPYLHPRLAARQPDEGDQGSHEDWLRRMLAAGLLAGHGEPRAIEYEAAHEPLPATDQRRLNGKGKTEH